jgi:AGZA family xanthine/uracil permease-like MFS transporter
VELKGGVPGGVVVLGSGILIAWSMHWLGFDSVVPYGTLDWSVVGLHLPLPQVADLLASLPQMLPYLPVILLMGLLSGILSLQNLESAKAAGDDFPARPALLTNGIGTVLAAFFGSPFPTTIYIGHPGWKAIGSRAGYSILTAIVIGFLCLTGLINAIIYAVPIGAGMAILIWIGIMMCSQAFEAVPRAHLPAVAVGLLPGIAAFGALISKHSFRSVGLGTPEAPFPDTLLQDFITRTNFFAEGMYALEAGYIYSSIVLAAATVSIIDQKFYRAAAWFLVGALLSALGLTHSFVNTGFDIIAELSPAGPWILGYLLMAAVCLAVPVCTRKTGREAV